MNILGIIPARYGSSRLGGKPLIDLCGKPMVQHVYERAKKALTDVLVATDDRRIQRAVKNFGGNVVMTSKKHNTGTNRCLEAYNIFKTKAEIDYEVVINIQGDEPLLDSEQIEQLASCFEDKSTEMATLVIPISQTPYQGGKPKNVLLNGGVFVVFDKNFNALYFSRSVIPYVRDAKREEWAARHTFYKHIGMYGFRPAALAEFAQMEQTSLELAESLEQNRWLENGNRIRVAITNIETVGVDTMDDLVRVREIIMKKN